MTGALAAGLQPVHMDPYGFCPAPDGHPHVRSLAERASFYTKAGYPVHFSGTAGTGKIDVRGLANEGFSNG